VAGRQGPGELLLPGQHRWPQNTPAFENFQENIESFCTFSPLVAVNKMSAAKVA
jgi:hypothetical protein